MCKILDGHKNIVEKLDFFKQKKKIPNIIFHGPNGSGKRTIVFNFINTIYNNNKLLKQSYVMFVNCAHGKGIKFIRDDLKFFAKTNINNDDGNLFKTVILSNADKLTIDAQSALRRCIELFTHTTRFFIIVEDKYKLLKPILSRFSEIYVPITPTCKTNNVYKFNSALFKEKQKDTSIINLKKYLVNLKTTEPLWGMAEMLYNKGYSGLDLINYININLPDNFYKYNLLLAIQKIKKEFRSENLLILFILNLLYFRSETDLENITFM